MSKYKTKKSKISTIVGIVVGVLLIAVCGTLVAGFAKSETTKISSTAFSVGGIDAEGNYEDVKTSIYTEKLFECQGLSVEPDFEATGTYQVFYYGADKNFMGATDVLNANEGVYNKGETFAFAKYARVMITPEAPVDIEEDEEFKIRFYEAVGYANDYTIKVNKEQNFSMKKALGTNTNVAKMLGEGLYMEEFEPSQTGLYFAEEIDLTNVNTVVMKVATESLRNSVTYNKAYFFPNIYGSYEGGERIELACGDSNDNVINYTIWESNSDFTYIAYDVRSISSILVCVDSASADVLEIYLIR